MAASSSRQFKNICVLSGFHYGKYKEFVQAAVDLGRAIAERKLHLVYGGGDCGLPSALSVLMVILQSFHFLQSNSVDVNCILPNRSIPKKIGGAAYRTTLSRKTSETKMPLQQSVEHDERRQLINSNVQDRTSDTKIEEKEAKKEAFRKYLDASGVLDALTKVLAELYEQNDKPFSALE
ncbi:uncharacterized protein LOC112099914 [Citrus clementina]|nr:uncharacterized protein LOC112099914 [Citrus x clementina]